VATAARVDNKDRMAKPVRDLEGIHPYDLDSRLSDVESDVDNICSTLDFALNLYTC
jgi:hypothetical protein